MGYAELLNVYIYEMKVCLAFFRIIIKFWIIIKAHYSLSLSFSYSFLGICSFLCFSLLLSLLNLFRPFFSSIRNIIVKLLQVIISFLSAANTNLLFGI